MAAPQILYVLVVDDERAFSEEFQDSLSDEHEIEYHVTPAENSADALEAVRRGANVFDVLLIDQRLLATREDGIDVMRTLLEASPESVAIVLTGYSSAEDSLRALEAGAKDYIHKSADWPEVFRLLKIKIAFLAASQRMQRETEWFHKLNEIGQRFQECVNRDQVAQAIIEGAVTLGFEQARLWQIFYEPDDEIWLKGWKQLPADHLPDFEGAWMGVDRSPYSRQTLQGRGPQKYMGRDLGPSPVDHLYPKPEDAVNEGVWLDVPLWNEKSCLAKLSLYHYKHTQPLDQLVLTVVELYAHQAAAALHRIQLFEKTEIEGKLAIINEQLTPRSERELDTLLVFIYDQVRAALQAEDGFICLLDPDTRKMDFRLKYVTGQRVAQYTRDFDEHQGLTGHLIATGKALWLPRNVPQFLKQHHLKRLSKRIPKSWLGAPIRYEGKVLGVIILRDYDSELAFTDWDRQILEAIADQAATALNNARLSMQVHRAAQQLAMLQYISGQIIRLAPDDLIKMLHVALTAVTASYGLRLNRAMLFLKIERTGELMGYLGIGHLRKQDAERDWERDAENEMTFAKYLARLEKEQEGATPLEKVVPGLRLRLDDPKSIFTEVYETGKRYRVSPREQKRLLPTAFRRAVKPHGEMVLVPLRTQADTIGILVVDNSFNQSPIADETLEHLQAFVNQAAIAIENTRAHRAELNRQIDELKAHNALQKAIMDFGAESDLPQVLGSVVQAAKKTLKDIGAITMFYQDPTVGDLRLGGQLGVEVPSKVGNKPPRPESAVRRALQLNQPRYVKDSTKHELTQGGFVKREKIRSTAVFPLKFGSERVGCMFFNYRAAKTFPPQERTELELFSNQAALAIHKALHNDQQKRSQRRLETVTQITPMLNATLDPEQVVAAILKGTLGALSKAKHAAMLYYQRATDDLEFARVSFEFYQIDNPKYQGQLRVEASADSIARSVIKTGKALIVDDVHKNKHYLNMISTTHSELCVPIKDGQELLGLLVLESDEKAAFSADDALLLTVLADQTAIALKKAKEHAELVKMQDELAANDAIAWTGLHGSIWTHAVNQKAAVIEGAVLLLRELVPNRSSEINEWLNKIENSVADLKMLRLEGIGTEGPGYSSTTLVLDTFMALRLETWRVKYSGLTFVTEFRCGSAQVAIEERWLDNCLETLVSNANKAMSSKGTLTIHSLRHGDRVEVFFQDTGPGIPEFALPYLLVRPVPKPTLRDGTGIGLLITRKVLKACHGDLELVRTAKDEGTTFMFYLPVAEPAM